MSPSQPGKRLFEKWTEEMEGSSGTSNTEGDEPSRVAQRSPKKQEIDAVALFGGGDFHRPRRVALVEGAEANAVTGLVL